MSDVRDCLIRNGMHPEFEKTWDRICDEHEAAERKWVSDLRARGVKASHPNDGWVNRQEKELHLCYPQFDDGADVGCLVMLGWPNDSERLVRLTGKRTALFGTVYYKFEDVTP